MKKKFTKRKRRKSGRKKQCALEKNVGNIVFESSQTWGFTYVWNIKLDPSRIAKIIDGGDSRFGSC